MSGVDINSVINLIMENPELISEIKRIAEGSGESAAVKAEVNDTERQKEEIEIEKPIEAQGMKRNTGRGGVRRGELLRALSPYISSERQKAIETFMTIADILDMMRSS